MWSNHGVWRMTSSASFVTDVTSARLTLNDCCAVISSAQLLMGASSIGNWTSMALLPEGFVLNQCLFGEHLLRSDDIRKSVALVEAEKTALLGSLVFPDYVWVAVGGKENFKPERMVALCNRTVIVFPDVDAFDDWKEKARKLFLPKRVIVCDLLERLSSAAEREAKVDVGDWFVADLMERGTANWHP